MAYLRLRLSDGTVPQKHKGETQMVQAKPEQACDIVMKGGITSGVVYPLALVELAKKYRFSSIGGTSAGAIAAAAAAAAEYGRQKEGAGFERLAKIPQEVGPNLLSLFQPTPILKPLLNIFIATRRRKAASASCLQPRLRRPADTR